MNDDSDKHLPGYILSLENMLKLQKAILRRYCEIAIEEMERDLLGQESLDAFDEIAVSSYLHELGERVREAVSMPKSYRKSTTREEYNLQLILAAKRFPNVADLFRSHIMEESPPLISSNIKERLDSIRRRVADRFARQFVETIQKHEITSPIEQVFLMEWHLSDVATKHQLSLVPQAPIEVTDGTFFLDFLVGSAPMACRKYG